MNDEALHPAQTTGLILVDATPSQSPFQFRNEPEGRR